MAEYDPYSKSGGGYMQAQAGAAGSARMTGREKLGNYLVNEGKKVATLIVYFLINCALFGITWGRYRAELYIEVFTRLGYGVTIARAAAACLNLNTTLMFLPVCRTMVTKLRSTWARRIMPLDMAIEFHKFVAYMVVFFSLLHAGSHELNVFHSAEADQRDNDPDGKLRHEYALQTVSGVTGHLLVCIMFIMYSAAQERIRRMCFELFWYTHHLFVLFVGLLCIHGGAGTLQSPQFWGWALLPCMMYAVERGLRIFQANATTYVTRIIQHPNRVFELQFKKAGFNYKSGEYLFLNCQTVSIQEWHPFTISSAPEEDYVSVHFKVVGDWTRGVADLMGLSWDKTGTPLPQQTPADIDGMPFRIDGPYGAAADEVFDYPVLLLVGAGIGVTPFASILKSVWYRMQSESAGVLEKVYFVWVARNKDSFEWFGDLLQALEEENVDNFLDLRVFLTGALSIDDVKQIMMLEEEGSPDAVTGLRAPTYYGRPNFEKIIQELCQKHPNNTVGVFLCGPAAIDKQLHFYAAKYTDKRIGGTKFVYHKEHF